MESFLRQKLAQASGNLLGRSSLQKPISSYHAIKLPDVCSSFYSIADEPFPQVSGFLDDTFGPSFLSNEAGTVLNSPGCTPSENQTKNKDDGVLAPRKEAAIDSGLSCSLGAHCQSADGRISTRSIHNEKDVSATADKADGHCNEPTVSTTSLEKSDFMSAELKNSTFDVTQDSKERFDTGVNVTVDLHNTRKKNSTFECQESKERSDTRLNSTVDIADNVKTESGNTTVDLVQSHDPKESPDTRVNATVDIPNLDSAHSKTNSPVNSAPLNTTTEQLNEKLEVTIDIQPQEKPSGNLNSTVDDKIKNTEEANLKDIVMVDIVEQIASAPHLPSSEIEQSSSDILKPAKTMFTEHNTTTDLHVPEVPVLKDTTLEMKPSSTELTLELDQVSGASNSVVITKPVSNSSETNVEISTLAFVCSVEAPELKAEEHHKKIERPGLAESESVPSSDMGNISRNIVFCLDDTLDMKTSFMVTSTPIVFGREPRFEILRDAKPTPIRKRLSVINSIEAQSNDELVGVSNHNGTGAVQATESSSQKVSSNCISSHSTSEPANENKPPTKRPIKRQLPQLSSKLSYPKSSLPPRPQSSMHSSVADKKKTIQGPQVPQYRDTTSTTLLGNRKSVHMNKGKNIAPVKNTASASTVKASMVSSATGFNFTAVAKPSSSGIPQNKPSGLQPPTRKRLALKTPQTSQSSVETILTQPSNNKPKTTGIQAHVALSTVESDAVHSADGAHESGCVNCLHHQDKLERVLQELMGLRSECKNWGPLHEKLEMCVKEMKK
ncbi:uncharacterized protein si:ch211-126c2.4 isoform X2 [Rhinichthys klamathensis goyatoka]|uniref:uncharacterized protein si:ch211-126c2.4 isoform X2 n=1 Tax=Rhinichthys klamathensis goyatoka TaxID=3034132 RepID=UPI0024B4D0E1|nr:uncharacterized protein si:ch211-126c2.4 isoform X2 [Rhinichthys klamathensis goyatoka]